MPPRRRQSSAIDPASQRESSQSAKPKGAATDALQKIEQALNDARAGNVTFAPDHLAPAVDADLLEKYLDERLTPDEAEQVARLVGTFRSWYDACVALQRGRLKK